MLFPKKRKNEKKKEAKDMLYLHTWKVVASFEKCTYIKWLFGEFPF